MIKVLNIISDSNIGGAGRCVLTFLKYFDRTKFDVEVVVPRNSLLIPEINKLGIKTIEADTIAEKSLSGESIKELSVHKTFRFSGQPENKQGHRKENKRNDKYALCR